MAGVRDQSSGTYYAGGAATDATNRIQYSAHGAVSVMKLGNGLWEHTNFNTRLQPSEIGLGTSSTSSGILGLTYDYGTTNNNGNVLSVSYAGGGLSYTHTFGYDSLNRLTTSQEGSAWSQTNSYDRYGNRSIVGAGLSFNTANNRITNAGYVYDAVGNLTNDGLHSYGFDGDNRIKSVDGVSDVYRYDGEGNRVRKNFAAGEKFRMVYSVGQLIAEYDPSSGALQKEYVYGGKGLIATVEPTAGTKYTTADHLDTPRVVTNSNGTVLSRHDYMPFGEEIGAGIGGRTGGMGFSVVDGLRQTFTSYQRDNESGLNYAINRYFSPTDGRFTTVDPLHESGEPPQPQSWNRYAYAINNPLKFVDPDGLRYVQRTLSNGRVEFGWCATDECYNNAIDKKNKNYAGWTAVTFDESKPFEYRTIGGGGGERYANYRLNPNGTHGFADVLDGKYRAMSTHWEAQLAIGGVFNGLRGLLSGLFSQSGTRQAISQATKHGAERLAERGFTSADITLTKSGSQFLQKDGARVFLKEVSSGRFNVIVEGQRGVVTALKDVSERKIAKLARNYGWYSPVN
ncbi:MAG TPA: RHS repeat-associated core domain-containing protein [Pyrinomonadaceae bacterium]|nr:RHS repeat-associated core domain-containing protein [Pyrinomonadaceae bacterium]